MYLQTKMVHGFARSEQVIQRRNRVSDESHRNRENQIGKIFHFRNGEQYWIPIGIHSTKKYNPNRIPTTTYMLCLNTCWGNFPRVYKDSWRPHLLTETIKMGPRYTKSIGPLTKVWLIIYFMMGTLHLSIHFDTLHNKTQSFEYTKNLRIIYLHKTKDEFYKRTQSFI